MVGSEGDDEIRLSAGGEDTVRSGDGSDLIRADDGSGDDSVSCGAGISDSVRIDAGDAADPDCENVETSK